MCVYVSVRVSLSSFSFFRSRLLAFQYVQFRVADQMKLSIAVWDRVFVTSLLLPPETCA